MLLHYFTIAWRNLWKNRVFSLINVFGLAVGLACCLLMTLYVRHELRYDQFQKKGDRIARVIMEYGFSGSVNKGNYTSTKVAPTFKRTFPEIESAVRMTQLSRVVRHEDKLFNEKKFMYADSSFFDVFEFRMLRGSPQKALNGPNVVVLTAAAATKYFGREDPVGKILKVGANGEDYLVTGVMENYPSNSQMQFNFLASFSSLGVNQEETYWNANYTTYFLLRDKEAIAGLQAKIPGFMKKEMGTEASGNDYLTFWLEPFTRIHLHSPYAGFEPTNSSTYVTMVGAVALLVLLIACFTYINLSTARSIERAKEVGVRKVLGAWKGQVFRQFLLESFMLTVSALVLGIVLTLVVLPSFNILAERQLSSSSLFSPFILGFSLLVILFVSLLAGSYPALLLSRFQPVKVLKGPFKNTASGQWLRQSLIVFQFAISIFLMVASFTIQKQLHFIQTKSLGYDREQVLVLPIDKKVQQNIKALKTDFKSNPRVLHVTRAVNDPTNILGGYSMRRPDMPEGKSIMVTADPVDEEFIKTTGIRLISGTDFTEQDVSDAMKDNQEDKFYHYILNESAAKEMGWTPEEAVGKKMFLGDHRPGVVKGVIRDFHFSSFRNPIRPLVLFNESWTNTLLVKISGNDVRATISFLQNKWKQLVTHRPFEYHFLDEDYNKLYSSERRLGQVLHIFTGIAVLLACLGLFGLSAYAIQQRTKEIGIRKIVGATVLHVVVLLSKDFMKLVLLAMLIAFPVAGWILYQWLQDFVYRIDIGYGIFLLAAALSLLIAFATVSYQSIRAAITNPVKSLRTE